MLKDTPRLASVDISGHADRFDKPLFQSLWLAAWGDQYPADVAPFSSCTKSLLDQLVEDLGLSEGQCLVDLGCGTGGVGLWLAKQSGARLIGIDQCADAVAIARECISRWVSNEAASFRVGDFCHTDLASASTDAVISIDALPAARDVEAALREIRRILRPGGTLLFTTRDPNPANTRHAQLGRGWRDGLLRNGFAPAGIWERPEVSELWRSLYAQWIRHESGLRAELLSETVDDLIGEAHRVGPNLDDGRPWLLVKAVARA